MAPRSSHVSSPSPTPAQQRKNLLVNNVDPKTRPEDYEQFQEVRARGFAAIRKDKESRRRSS